MKRKSINGGHGALHFYLRFVCVSAACLIVLGLVSSCQQTAIGESPNASKGNEQANVLIIVVDDAGFSDLGFFGGEIPTPNIDALANNGVALSNFHAAPTCSPTRSMLLSGVDSHIAGLGNMFEELAPNQKGKVGYEGYLHERVAPLPALFQEAGYRTYMSGKWHLGLADDQAPTQRGFDRAFSLLQGGAGHFADMQSLWETEVGNRGKAKYRENGKMLDQLPESFEYSSQYYVDKLLEYLRSDKQSDAPFFAYLAFTAPHWPLQAPPEAIARYKGKYDAGYQVLAQQRLQRQIELGLLPPGTQLSPLPDDAPEWDALSDSERALSARRMEIYAAMIDELDRHTGRLINALKASGELNNTIIVFMSDNGAEGHSLDALFPEPVFPKARDWVLGTFNYDLDSLGGADSYVLYGPGWGWAATSAFRGYKAYVTQGGTRVPAFVYYPKKLAQGVVRDDLLSVKDIAPTLLELSGVANHNGHFKGRDVSAITGRSMLPLLRSSTRDDVKPSQSNNRVLGFELFGKRSIRQGPWNLLEMYQPQGTGEWQLYNVVDDPGEQNDLAEQEPEKLKALIELWNQYEAENGVIIPDWNSGY